MELIADPAIKAHVRRLLSPGHQTRECVETTSRSCRQQSGGGEEVSTENNSRQTGNHEDKSVNRKSSSPELPIGSPQAPIGASQYATRSNGSYSDASGSSEFEALLPQIDSFKEEERAQWEPLSGDKFSRQKNTPR